MQAFVASTHYPSDHVDGQLKARLKLVGNDAKK
jgi:hypothetical protein